jgi:hypothetical protein
MGLVATVSQRVNAYDLASLYLQRLGVPNALANLKIMVAWFKTETPSVAGSATDIYVRNNNTLDIVTSSSVYHQFPGNNLHFAVYDSIGAGADAWASLIARRYPGIQAALQAQDASQFAAAVGASPFGTSTKLFNSVYPRVNAAPAGGTGSLPQGTNVSYPTTGGTMLSDLFTTSAPGSKFTQMQLDFLIGDIPQDNPNRDKIIATYRGALGKPLNTIPKQTGTFSSPSSVDPITAVAQAIAGIPGALVGVIVPVAVLVALLWIGKVGLQKTLG